jgi:2-phosphosulfolactate phosphatase
MTGRANLEWGVSGAKRAAARGDVVVVVDVLRFTSTVVTATAAGAMVYPYRGTNAAAYARQVGAELARGSSRFSLSPLSFADAQPGARVVLPSPNGATVTWHAARACPVYAGALINAKAAAEAAGADAASRHSGLTVVACGERPLERWQDERSYEFRPAIEDWLGAGAILAVVGAAAELSAEAGLAARAFASVGADLAEFVQDSESGRELVRAGRAADVEFCGTLDLIAVAPILSEGAFVAGALS